MVWDVEENQWERQFEAVCAYLRENGNLDISSRYKTPEGLRLGQWLQRMRRYYKKGLLPRERVRRLEAIGVTWDGLKDRQERFGRAAPAGGQEQ